MPVTIFGSTQEFLLATLIVAFAQTIYVLFGFGSGLIAVGCLALLLPEVKDVVVILLLINLPAEMFIVSRSRRNISWRGVLPVSLGIVVGVPVGTAILRVTEPTLVLTLLGISLLGIGFLFVRLPDGHGLRWPRWVAPASGLLSGLLSGLFGTGGPPLVVYYHLSGLAKRAFRANLMATFFLVTLVRLPSYAIGGLLTGSRLWSSVALLPAVVLGTWLGNRIHLEVPERTFRRLVSIALMAIGLLLLLRR